MDILALICISVLSIVVVIQIYWINALVNKVMSSNFYDYQISKGVDKHDKKGKISTEAIVRDESEDLSYLG